MVEDVEVEANNGNRDDIEEEAYTPESPRYQLRQRARGRINAMIGNRSPKRVMNEIKERAKKRVVQERKRYQP